MEKSHNREIDVLQEKIDVEKTQSVIVDYIDSRRKTEFFMLILLIFGVLIMILSGYITSLQTPLLVGDGIDAIKTISILAIIFGIGICVILFSGMFIFGFLYKRSETLKTISSIHNTLIHKLYFINFEHVSSTGNSRLEKLINHLGLVFPEIQKKLTKLEKKQKTIDWFQKHQKFSKKINFLNDYDLFFRTTMGLFVIKIFDKPVTFEDLENITKQLHNHNITTKIIGSSQVERVIILSKSYDDLFNTPNIDKKMNSLKHDFNFDLILEDEDGYTIIWVD